MKTKYIILIILVILLVLSNIYPLNHVLRKTVDGSHYRYSNYNGSYTSYEFMSRNFKMMKRLHNMCLDARPELKDKNMYRLFTKNPLAFWRWGFYLFDERYKLPYRNWEEIEKIRAKENIKPLTGCYTDF